MESKNRVYIEQFNPTIKRLDSATKEELSLFNISIQLFAGFPILIRHDPVPAVLLCMIEAVVHAFKEHHPFFGSVGGDDAYADGQ